MSGGEGTSQANRELHVDAYRNPLEAKKHPGPFSKDKGENPTPKIKTRSFT